VFDGRDCTPCIDQYFHFSGVYFFIIVVFMFGDAPRNGVQEIGFLLLDRFSMMALSSAMEPLRMANAVSDRELYRWTLISRDGGPVQASNGLESLVRCSMENAPTLPMIVVLASYDPHLSGTRDVLQWLRRRAAMGAVIGGVDTGSDVLAAAGLLDGYRATIHWMMLDLFAEKHPDVEAMQDIFVIDRNRFTAAGATAGLDMMLHLIRTQHGPDLAAGVADQFIYHNVRESGVQQRNDVAHRFKMHHPALGRALKLMSENLEEPLQVPDIASRVGLSVRALERAFQKWLKTTPAKYHRRLRLEHAREMIRLSDMPVLEIAIRAGFNSAAHFSGSYKAFFGHPPSADRGHTRINQASA